MNAGSLAVIGTGITLGVHITPEAQAEVARADRFFYLAAEPATSAWLRDLHPRGESLHSSYSVGSDRFRTYLEMVERILGPLREGACVCAAFYGHPGVFVYPSHEAVRRAREEGFEARLLPAISAEDCLFADLNVDPGATGCQSYEATDFLIHSRPVDPSTALVLWQISVIGRRDAVSEPDLTKVPVLVDHLCRFYPADHVVYVYEASCYPAVKPYICPIALGRLAEADLSAMSSLYVPPARKPVRNAEMAQLLHR